MGRTPGGPEPIDWGKLLPSGLRRRGGSAPSMPKLSGWVWLIPLAIVVIIWLLTGIYTVGPGSQGVVRQFGQEVGKTGSGLHYHLPWPIQKATVVNLAGVRRLNIGFREVSAGQFQSVPHEALMLTSDENIVDIHVIVQYRVLDASDFLFQVRDVEGVLRTATEAALRSVVGNTVIDDVLTERRTEVQDETKILLQGLMDSYRSGVTVTEVKLQEVDAPNEIRDAFNEVVRAKEDSDRFEREAEGYLADVVPRARGEKAQTVKGAEAFMEQRILRAQGDAERYISVLEEYRKAKAVTRQRLYLETMERILPGIDKIILDTDTSSNLLPFLPLKGFTGLEAPPIPAGPPAGSPPVE